MDFDIRSLYAPIQPDVELADQYISYKEFLPHPELRHDIYCYWQLQTHEILPSNFTYRVVADGCIDIFFNANILSESFVIGLCKQYTSFDLGEKFNYIGIRFLPAKFPLLFEIDAKILTDTALELQLVQLETAQFISEKLDKLASIETTCSLLDQFFLQILEKSNIKVDVRVERALKIILQSKGILDIEKDLDVGLSSRQLRRLFEFYTGTTLKTFCGIVRFQHLLRAYSALGTTKNPTLFLGAGYFDQSHFIKEFKKLYGLTPKQALLR